MLTIEWTDPRWPDEDRLNTFEGTEFQILHTLLGFISAGPITIIRTFQS